MSRLLVETVTKHVSPDGVLRKPGSDNSRFLLPEGVEPYKHVVVIEGDEPEDENTGEGDSADNGKEASFEELNSEGKLEKIASCEDKMQLAQWAEDLPENSRAFKAITAKIQAIELDFNDEGGTGGNE